MVSLAKVVILALGYWQRTYLPCRGRQFFEKAFKEGIYYTQLIGHSLKRKIPSFLLLKEVLFVKSTFGV